MAEETPNIFNYALDRAFDFVLSLALGLFRAENGYIYSGILTVLILWFEFLFYSLVFQFVCTLILGGSLAYVLVPIQDSEHKAPASDQGRVFTLKLETTDRGGRSYKGFGGRWRALKERVQEAWDKPRNQPKAAAHQMQFSHYKGKSRSKYKLKVGLKFVYLWVFLILCLSYSRIWPPIATSWWEDSLRAVEWFAIIRAAEEKNKTWLDSILALVPGSGAKTTPAPEAESLSDMVIGVVRQILNPTLFTYVHVAWRCLSIPLINSILQTVFNRLLA